MAANAECRLQNVDCRLSSERPHTRQSTIHIRHFLLAVSLVATAAAESPPEDAVKQSPEESRLSVAVFRAGLMKRGLSELLELHLKTSLNRRLKTP